MPHYIKKAVSGAFFYPHNMLISVNPSVPVVHIVVMNDWTTFGVRDRSGANDGDSGDAYEGCFRLNIGCPRAQLLDALDRIARVVG